MNATLVGNALSLCAMLTDSFSSTRKKREQILGIQCVTQVLYAACSIVLKGYSSVAQNAVALVRNLAAIKNVNSKVLQWALILLGVVLGAAVNNLGLMGWLPIIANLEYSICVFYIRERENSLKAAFIVNALMFAAFNLAIQNYVGTASNTVVAVTTLISILRGRKAA